MKTSFDNIDKIFEFEGLWGVKSKCGLKISQKEDKFVVIASELYLDNPGTSVTQAACILAKQICKQYHIPPEKLIYIEHNPDMNSKLSFYDEEFFLVTFQFDDNGDFSHPQYTQLNAAEIKDYLNIE